MIQEFGMVYFCHSVWYTLSMKTCIICGKDLIGKQRMYCKQLCKTKGWQRKKNKLPSIKDIIDAYNYCLEDENEFNRLSQMNPGERLIYFFALDAEYGCIVEDNGRLKLFKKR